MQAILRAIEPDLKTSKQARTCRKCLLANRHQLNYPRFRRMGLYTSNGVVKAGCKLVVGTRLKPREHALDRRRRERHHGPLGVQTEVTATMDGYWNRRHAA